VAAVLVFALATLPPHPVRTAFDGVDPQLAARTMSGAHHIHTSRSDGAGDRLAVATAAARAGLNFVILTDHGDATRPPDPPAYIDGVLCIDAVEISTNGGHYVALGLPQSPYPLAGEASAVVEDVERLGGFGIVSHPDHPRGELAWTGWDLPIDGLEWMNADAEWRGESVLEASMVLFHYLFRPAPAMAATFDRPDQTIARWDAMNRVRRVVAMAAVDAHGGRGGWESDQRPVTLGPTYEASFRTLTNRVVLEAPPSGDAARDASQLLMAVRRGRTYSVVDAISPDVLVAMSDEGVALRSPLPDGATVVEMKDGVATRLEVGMDRAPGQPPVPWVLTNWVRTPTPLPASHLAPAGESAEPLSTGEWRVEHSPGSTGQVQAGEGGFALQYQLRGGDRDSQFVAAAADLAEAVDGIFFEGIADRPMRVSVQLRYPPEDHRWASSVYLDATTRTVFVPVEEMRAADAPAGTKPPSGAARSLLFVVDLVNARPGDGGRFEIRGIRAVR
jgi:hypothetical protein